jgi:hypothetical protein
MRLAPLGTGHNAHPLGDLSKTVLVRTSRLNAVSIDPDARTARAEAGAVWGPIAEQASPLGLAALHGSAPDAGVVGYTLGGGINWYGRSRGLAVNTVTAVELITADGSLARADAEHEPDLFWALRGGGAANFGLVTALEFALFRLTSVYAGMMLWDLRDAPEVLARWAELVADAPEELTLSYRHLNFPPIPQVPEPFRGRRLVIVDGAALGSDPERLIAPLRELSPEVDTFAEVPPVAVARIHMDPEFPTPGWGRSALLDDFPAAAVDRLIEVAGIDSGNDLALAAEVRQLGGAMSRARAASLLGGAQAGDGHAGQAEDAADQGEHRRGLAQGEPGQQDGDAGHQVRRRGELAGGGALQRVRPGAERDGSRKEPQIDDAEGRGGGSRRGLAHEAGGEGQAHDGAEEAAEPGGREGADRAQGALLQEDADGVERGGAEGEENAGDVVPAGRGGGGDDGHADEGDGEAGDEAAGEAFAEVEAGQDGDEDRAEVDDQGGRPGVEVAFGRVDEHGVEAEPQRAVRDDEHERAAARELGPDDQGDRREGDGAGEHAAEGQGAGAVVVADRADHDERGGPEQHRDAGGGQSGPVGHGGRDSGRHDDHAPLSQNEGQANVSA